MGGVALRSNGKIPGWFLNTKDIEKIMLLRKRPGLPFLRGKNEDFWKN
jgi:hypothetical protein